MGAVAAPAETAAAAVAAPAPPADAGGMRAQYETALAMLEEERAEKMRLQALVDEMRQAGGGGAP